MDRRNEVRDFLVSRRAKLTPDQVGLHAGHNRRVPGLRRSEVAALAGLSVEYYAKIERGAIDSASEQVLDAIARPRRAAATSPPGTSPSLKPPLPPDTSSDSPRTRASTTSRCAL